MEKKSNLMNVASMIVLLNLGGKVLAFLRESIIASRLGTTPQADAYTYANQLSTITFLSIAAAILTALIPTFVEIRQAEGKSAFYVFANKVLSLLMLIALGVIIGINIVTYLIKTTTTNSQMKTTSELVGILIISILLITITYVFIAILQSMNRFKAAALITYPFNLLLVTYAYFFADKEHLKELAIVMVLAWILQALVLVPDLLKQGYRFKWQLDLKDSQLRHIGKIIVPITFISLVHQNNVTIDGLFVADMAGQRAAINFANTIYVSIVTVLIYGIMTVAYPKISEKRLEGHAVTHAYIKDIVSILAFLLIPLTIGFIFLGEDIIRLIYGRGEFGEESIQLTKTVLSYYALGAFGFGLLEVLSKTYFTQKDYKPPLLVVLGINISNILLTTLLKPLGLEGIVLSSGLVMTLGSIGFFIYYLYKNQIKIEKKEAFNGIKIVCASLIMLLAIKVFALYSKHIFYQETMGHISLRLITTTLIGGGIYGLTNLLLKEKNTWDIVYSILGEKRLKNEKV